MRLHPKLCKRATLVTDTVVINITVDMSCPKSHQGEKNKQHQLQQANKELSRIRHSV